MSIQIRKTQLVELVIAGVSGGQTQTQFQFTPQTYLQGKPMWGLEVLAPLDLAKSPLSQNALLPSADMINASLTLYFQDPDFNSNGNQTQPSGQYIQYRSLWSFHRINNGTDPWVFNYPEMAGQVVTWEKSFVTFTTAPVNTTNYSICFDVIYSN